MAFMDIKAMNAAQEVGKTHNKLASLRMSKYDPSKGHPLPLAPKGEMFSQLGKQRADEEWKKQHLNGIQLTESSEQE